MMIQPENFKGITFIRISHLPPGQKTLMLLTIDHQKIFKLLKDKQLMVDCLHLHHYQEWYAQVFKPGRQKRELKAAKDLISIP